MRKLAAILLLGFGIMNCGFLAVHYQRDLPLDRLLPHYADTDAQFIDILGARLHVMDEGPRSGVPLLMIHGMGSSLHTWDGWTEALGDTYRLIRFDLPGFGLTGPNEDDDYTISHDVETTIALLDHLGVEQVVVAGNSLGGQIAWRLALDHPTRVSHLILIDAAGYTTVDGRTRNVTDSGRVPLFKSLLRKVTPRGMVEQGLKDVYFDDTRVSPALVERHHRLLLRAGNRDAMIDRLNAPWEDREDEISSIHQPTLILWGKEDRWIPPAVGVRFAADLPQAELIVYPNAGHIPMEELPRETARDVLEFLGKHPLPVARSTSDSDPDPETAFGPDVGRP